MKHVKHLLFCTCGSLAQQWNARRQQREKLQGLSADQLNDIGINQFDALQEARKPFWKP